jgi:glyoxylase-like metal-dependent hydrolase (beta-lactamase superfamily II)
MGSSVFAPILLRTDNAGPMTAEGNNTFLIIGERGTATLIDAGQGDAAHLQLLAAHVRMADAQLDRVLVTHAHADHASGCVAIAAEHRRAAFFKHPWPGEDHRYTVDWQELHDAVPIDIGGDMLVALHTPGHSPDHLAFWHEASGTCFVGDLVTAGGSVMIDGGRGGDIARYLASLRRLRSLQPARLLAAHGAPIDDPAAVLTWTIEHRLAREAQVIGALAAGNRSVQAIAESIYDGLNPALLPAAHATVGAHLEKLRREGRASVDAELWSMP